MKAKKTLYSECCRCGRELVILLEKKAGICQYCASELAESQNAFYQVIYQ